MASQQSIKLRSNDMYSNGATGLATFFYKVELESMADAVQWVIGSGVGSGTPGEYMAQAAFTDEIRVDTPTRAFVPMRGGVAYNDKSEFGWKDLTFGGAVSKRIGLAPSTGNSCITMATDVLSMPSVARADGKPGCILLVKVVQIDAAGAFTQDKSTNQAWDAARGVHPWFREFFSVKRNGVNAITTLTALPTGVAESNTGYCAIGFPIVSVADKNIPAELVMFTGDSIRAAAYSTHAFNNPNCQALLPLSTPARPISIVNLTGSGHSQIQYQQVAMDALTTGLRPTVLYMPGFSQNGFNNDPSGFINRNNNFMAAVRAIPGLENIKFVLDTDYWGVPTDANVRQCINHAKSLVNNTTVFLFDSEAIMIDFTNPSAPVRHASYMDAGESANGKTPVHANQAGQDALTYGYGSFPGLVNLYKSLFSSSKAVLPATPVIGTATAGNGSITVPFTAPANNGGSAILDYVVTAGGVTATGTSSPITVTGLPAGAAVTPTVRARNIVGSGPVSVPSNSVTPTEVPAGDTTAPVMTGEITVSGITTSGATLSCPAATDAVGVAGYEYSINGGTSYSVIANASRSVTVSGRPAGTAHPVRMRAFDAAGNRATPLAASFTTLAEQPAQNAVAASTVAESRRVAFPGGTRVVAFGTVPGAATPNAPFLEAGRWWSEKHPLDERYWVADITIDLDERATTATSVERIVAGVTVLEEPVIQGKLIAVKLGGFNAATGAINYCTFRVTCANGERFDRTIWFKQPVGTWWINKDADDQSYYVADIGNDLIDSGTTATAVKAFPVGVIELVPAVIQGPLILVKLGGMDSLPAGVNYCDFRIDCANGERFYRSMQFNRVDN